MSGTETNASSPGDRQNVVLPVEVDLGECLVDRFADRVLRVDVAERVVDSEPLRRRGIGVHREEDIDFRGRDLQARELIALAAGGARHPERDDDAGDDQPGGGDWQKYNGAGHADTAL